MDDGGNARHRLRPAGIGQEIGGNKVQLAAGDAGGGADRGLDLRGAGEIAQRSAHRVAGPQQLGRDVPADEAADTGEEDDIHNEAPRRCCGRDARGREVTAG